LTIEVGDAEILPAEFPLRLCWSSAIRDEIILLISLLSSIEKMSCKATIVSYFTPAGNRPPFGASNPNKAKRLTTSPSERGADK